MVDIYNGLLTGDADLVVHAHETWGFYSALRLKSFAGRSGMGVRASVLAVMLFASVAVSPPALSHDPAKPLRPDPSMPEVAALDRVRVQLHNAERVGIAPDILSSARTLYVTAAVWKKSVITVCFWNGVADVRKVVANLASKWSETAKFDFSFGEKKGEYQTCQSEHTADIRVALDHENAEKRLLYGAKEDPRGNWSRVGSFASEYSKPFISLNLGTPGKVGSQSFTRAVLHEFGHALGLKHEHQRELCEGWFNYEQIAKDNGWDVEKAKANVKALPTSSGSGYATVGPYDRDSIMQYNFAANWYVNKLGNPCKRDRDIYTLSPRDIAGIETLYGKRNPFESDKTLVVDRLTENAIGAARTRLKAVRADAERNKEPATRAVSSPQAAATSALLDALDDLQKLKMDDPK